MSESGRGRPRAGRVAEHRREQAQDRVPRLAGAQRLERDERVGALALFAGAWQASITGLGTATAAFGTGLGDAADAYDMTDRCAIPRGGH